MSPDRWMDKEVMAHIYSGILCQVTQSCLTLYNPMDCSLPGSPVHRDSPGKNTGVGFHAILQGIFPTQGSNPCLPYCKQILYHLSHQGSPVEYYSANKKNKFESVEMRWMNLVSIIQQWISHKKISHTNTCVWDLGKWYWWSCLWGKNKDCENRGERRAWDEVREPQSPVYTTVCQTDS